MFYPNTNGVPFTAVLYIATSQNCLWMGDAPLPDIANQIANCSGPSGHNVEYLLRLASFMHQHFPDEHDEHLYDLEHLVKTNINDRKMSVTAFMGNGQNIVAFVRRGSQMAIRVEEQEERIDSFQFTARIPEKNLRCLNI